MSFPSAPFVPGRSPGLDAERRRADASMLTGLGRMLGRLRPVVGWTIPRSPAVPAEEETAMHSPCL